MHLSKYKYFALSLLLLLICAIPIGIWFKHQQLLFISPELIPNYPLASWLDVIFTVFLLFTITWAAWVFIISRFFKQAPLDLVIIIDALTFYTLLILIMGIPTQIVVIIFLMLKLIFVLYLVFIRKLEFKHYPYFKWHFVALLIIFLFLFFFNTVLSPLSWHNVLVTYRPESPGGVVTISTPLFKSQFVNAKSFDFSGFDASYWGTGNYSPTSLNSNLTTLLTFILNLPSINIEAFHKLILLIIFALFVFGSFGFYLYLFYALKLSFPISLLGGILFTFSNIFLGVEANYEFPSFLTSFLVLPYALLFLHLAFNKSNYLLVALAGLCMALPLYILAPHPEALIHATAFFSAYAVWQILFNNNEKSFLKKISLGALSAVMYALMSLAYLVPVFIKLLQGETILFGHQQGYAFKYGFVNNYVILIPCLLSFGAFIFWGINFIFQWFQEKKWRVDFAFYFLAFLLALWIFIPGSDGRLNLWLVYRLKFINFLVAQRALMYVHFVALALGMLGLNGFIKGKVSIKRTLIIFILYNVGIILFALLVNNIWKEINISEFYKYYPYIANPQILGIFGNASLLTLYVSIAIAGFLLLGLALLLIKFHTLQDQKIILKSIIFDKAITFSSLFVILISVPFIIFSPAITQFQTGRLIDNLNDCQPYIALQTLLVNQRNLSQDAANTAYIKIKLIKFEEDIASSNLPTTEMVYEKVLSDYGQSSARYLKTADVIAFAHRVAKTIDQYYLTQSNCISNAMSPAGHFPVWRIADYNNSAIFSSIDSIENTNRISFATFSDNSLGVGDGLFINNGNTSVDARFVSALPIINAIYLIPGFNFTHMPKYGELGYFARPWNLLAGQVLTPESRKMLDISGIDYLVIRQEEYHRLYSNAPQWKFEWASDKLDDGEHQLIIKPIIKAGTYFFIDAVIVESGQKINGQSTQSPPQFQYIDDLSKEFKYTGYWNRIRDINSYNWSASFSVDPTSEVFLNFKGNQVRILYPIMNYYSEADIYIDGKLAARIDESNGEKLDWSNLTQIPYQLPEKIDPQFAVIKNESSLGLAYFAKSIRFANSELIQRFSELYDPPLYSKKSEQLTEYLKIVGQMRRSLMDIKGKSNILIEKSELSDEKLTSLINLDLGGEILQANMVGDKAAFMVQCTKEPCVFVYNMANNFGWKAFVDQQLVKIRTANYAFMSIDVPQGDHLVWFEFMPITTIISKFISLLALVAICLGGLYLFQRQ